jgi:hypothetical protein
LTPKSFVKLAPLSAITTISAIDGMVVIAFSVNSRRRD